MLPARPRHVLVSAAIAVAALLGTVGTALAADPAPQVPANVTAPLGGVESPATVPYRQLVGAADARNLNAAVVDTSGYFPKQVTRTASKLADATEHYIFVSTLSAATTRSMRVVSTPPWSRT